MPLPLPQSTGQAITLASLTTMVGFGSLMISRHQGIYSLGLLVALGVGSVLLASLTVLPSLLALLASGQTKAEGLASKSWPNCLKSPPSSKSTADRGV